MTKKQVPYWLRIEKVKDKMERKLQKEIDTIVADELKYQNIDPLDPEAKALYEYIGDEVRQMMFDWYARQTRVNL